uniref:E3 ubiquitin-protein ligase RNF186 isoform X2 n=1 Tax=Jaculus jaculus TaxID=51337 RepID=UPI001E1AFAD7|nr:E3 ubiquitin-protein ligase RNF186 isoform X2 [Jaculus jaculus]
MSCTEASQQSQTISAGATTVIALDPAGHRRGSTEGDLECLVCRESYNCARSPKLLSCQHTFCAVCLKLLLYVQEDTWSITCPLCRKVTAVPGGLICSLRDQEAVVGQLALTCPESARQLALHQDSILPRTETKPDCFHCLRAPQVSAVLTAPQAPGFHKQQGKGLGAKSASLRDHRSAGLACQTQTGRIGSRTLCWDSGLAPCLE